MEIVYEDNHVLVVNKKAGIPTQEASGSLENVTDWAKSWVKRKYAKPGKVFLEPIHRLDKPVSGLVLFARTSKALSRLQEMMRKKEIAKQYLAWVAGVPDPQEKVLEHCLVHDEHKARVVASSHPDGKIAILSYRTVAAEKGYALLEIELQTGRYHQIRAQLAHVGHCILGDLKYGSTTCYKGEGIALHSSCLRFVHPVSKEALVFTAKAPQSFSSILGR